jgi:tripartite-type tricarboxylate transporter receptor subunit TctC
VIVVNVDRSARMQGATSNGGGRISGVSSVEFSTGRERGMREGTVRKSRRTEQLFLAVLGGLFLVALAAPPVRAQDYPTRPITIVVPFTPGGTTDILARMVGQWLEARLGQSFLIENKPGAGSVIGANAVAKAAPDGYTLLMATSTSMAVNVTLYKNLPYNPESDLIPLVLVARTPFVLVVNPSLPVRSVQDLIKLAKDRPGQLSYASAGPGTPHHLYAEFSK